MTNSDYVEAIVLGIVQGIAEFLPISSSGHLVILGNLFDRWVGPAGTSGNDPMQLNVALHFGTLLSILYVYRTDLIDLLRRPRVCVAIVVASIPAGIIGVVWGDAIESAFETPIVAGAGLLVTSLLLFVGQRFESGNDDLDDISQWTAFKIGLFQAAALIPGISRSGSTIAGGLLSGLNRHVATTFSFFIAIPVLFGATLLTAIKILESGTGLTSVTPLLVGASVSCAVGILALRGLIRVVAANRLHWFAIYCFFAGTISIVYFWQA